jgi:hypothetical protein
MRHERGHLFGSWNAGRRRAWVRRFCVAVILALVVSTAEVPSTSRPAAATPAAPAPAPKPACPDDRQDLASAAIAAKLCGARVEAVGRRTETTAVCS